MQRNSDFYCYLSSLNTWNLDVPKTFERYLVLSNIDTKYLKDFHILLELKTNAVNFTGAGKFARSIHLCSVKQMCKNLRRFNFDIETSPFSEILSHVTFYGESLRYIIQNARPCIVLGGRILHPIYSMDTNNGVYIRLDYCLCSDAIQIKVHFNMNKANQLRWNFGKNYRNIKSKRVKTEIRCLVEVFYRLKNEIGLPGEIKHIIYDYVLNS